MQTVVLLIGRGALVAVLAGVLAVPSPHARAQDDLLVPAEFADLSDERPRQVMHIGPGDTPGSMLVLTRHTLHELDATGARVREAGFPDELWLPFTTRLTPGGDLQVVGLRSRFAWFRSTVDILTTSGERLARLPSWQYGTPEAADVLGDAASEILVRHEDGVAVMDAAGRRLTFVRSPRYLYHFRTIALGGEPKRAIAMWMWRDAKSGSDISVLRADGSEVASWHENPSDRLAVFALDGDEEGLWSAVDGRFIERSPTGAIRRTLAAPGVRNFRYLHGGRLAGGWKVIVGFMGQYEDHVGTAVCVFDPAGALAARALSRDPAWAFYIPDHHGTRFFVSAGHHVLRYDIATLRAKPAG